MHNELDNIRNFIPFRSFNEAAQYVLSNLSSRINLDLWMVTQTSGNDWIVLAVEDHGYHVVPGDIFEWTDTFCHRMTRGLGPYIAPSSINISAYAEAPIGKQFTIGAYVGIPLVNHDGSLFGTLCALHPEAVSDGLHNEYNFIAQQARLLSTILSYEQTQKIITRELNDERYRSQIDELTGLYNRRGWKNFLNQELQKSAYSTHKMSVLILDIDHLKRINDTYGHAMGDYLITRTAACLKKATNASDIVCRIGGDEFSIFVMDANEQHLEFLTNNINRVLKDENIHASIGWATHKPGSTLSSVIRTADRRMYKAKYLSKS